MEHHGSCLCGEVRFTIKEAEPTVSACHCGMCRKWTSGPLLSIDAGSGKNVLFGGVEQIGRYRSSEWAERGFCKNCGSSLFYHGLEDDSYYIPIDLLDTVDQAQLTLEIMYDNKPEYYSFSNQTEKMTAAQVYQQFVEETEGTEN
ncbi:GFA family protein [Enterococcus sp. BWM-S5]|uniref:GFA family protein n=1 Tax=Enterococcus larvae TaxID=2794352 RepID=A0ABS4CLK1_9ENTE|nr:GFA family protein [Enterococcus larvae]MBP1047476.1 GFA family protein [Enterococcus larvae]